MITIYKLTSDNGVQNFKHIEDLREEIEDLICKHIEGCFLPSGHKDEEDECIMINEPSEDELEEELDDVEFEDGERTVNITNLFEYHSETWLDDKTAEKVKNKFGSDIYDLDEMFQLLNIKISMTEKR